LPFLDKFLIHHKVTICKGLSTMNSPHFMNGSKEAIANVSSLPVKAPAAKKKHSCAAHLSAL